MGLLIALFIYSILILFFVPLEKIGRVQTKVQDTIRKWIKKLND